MRIPRPRSRLPLRRPFGFLFAMLVLAGAHHAAEAAPPTSAEAVRFLEQSTWGPNPALVQHVQNVGFAAILQEQISAPISLYPALAPYPPKRSAGCPAGSPPTCSRDNYSMYPLQVQFFLNALSGPDQLRQRVAFALHEILVVSGVKVRQPSSMTPYLNMLARDALGNYRQLLEDLTLNPAMGHYLDMVDNDPASADGTVQPNENYAREVLQLFSIGVNMLNSDGSPIRGAAGNLVPAYDQDTIEGFAHVFTGWTYAALPGNIARRHNPPNFLTPMWLYRDARGFDPNHDKGSKKLLSYPGAALPVLPADQDGQVDLEEALDNIFHHPNVGPFLGKQLIQHLVTSNPSPGYVERIAAVFSNNGAGVRGDLAAVVRAILLDSEARGPARPEPAYGRLREPAQFVVNILRAFPSRSDGILNFLTKMMGQDLFDPPSVFSYYPHQYEIPGTSVQGPEFGIESTSVAIARANFVTTIVYSQIEPAAPATGTEIDLSGLAALASNPSNLLDSLNGLLLHGTMSDAMRAAILNAVLAVDASNPLGRAQAALSLVATSSQYQVER